MLCRSPLCISRVSLREHISEFGICQCFRFRANWQQGRLVFTSLLVCVWGKLCAFWPFGFCVSAHPVFSGHIICFLSFETVTLYRKHHLFPRGYLLDWTITPFGVCSWELNKQIKFQTVLGFISKLRWHLKKKASSTLFNVLIELIHFAQNVSLCDT